MQVMSNASLQIADYLHTQGVAGVHAVQDIDSQQ